jgi:hypothetical protein
MHYLLRMNLVVLNIVSYQFYKQMASFLIHLTLRVSHSLRRDCLACPVSIFIFGKTNIYHESSFPPDLLEIPPQLSLATPSLRVVTKKDV